MSFSEDTQNTVQDNKVVTLNYTLRVEGQIVDSSENGDPIQFIQGAGMIIPGLEQELYGMSVGESKQVVVQPKQGYGEVDEDAFADVPRSEFPDHIPMERGIALQLRDQQGGTLDAFIDEIRDETVRLSFNHPLAGKTLHFDVTVMDLRPATDEELSHGHIHGEGDDEDDYE